MYIFAQASYNYREDILATYKEGTFVENYEI